MEKRNLDPYLQGVLNRDRRMLAKTITLIESALPADQEFSRHLLDLLMPYTGKALSLGITGLPGAGKSTFIESFGTLLTQKGYRVAVLAVDPSSPKTGGSILADKTRMEKLAVNELAFIRPSPSGKTLGGVARKTRETMLVCEAAGFDAVMVETVGVGQSEVTVASMVDFFLVLMIAGGGDELQGIKKGVLELADAVAVNKADGDNIDRAKMARRQYETAFHLLSPPYANWTPPVVTCSSLTMAGLENILKIILDHRDKLTESGELQAKRKEQAREWLKFLVREGVQEWFYESPAAEVLAHALADVEQGVITPTTAAAKVLECLKGRKF
ncbi:MAG: methylmalonyl Co-A mutase-associated GTPase MeaB [Smithellaceae bacterium]|jgi:LAO/AO transport system kinase|nr:methylmalonyl Co-A mutase-associated GTPase MeaB [Syntrophaceae bacterium]MDD4241911.1 methylmalonyl Co-A mutase-associated GTPase MeaB [Smithellaceae bacterium]NLX51665.1 methylmalonyl Co-A mutase-associated GTPase MeaB [Deltaproteobacteria bacterium]